MAANARPPYFGAAYYPEDWPEQEIDREIPLMKRAGMNVMRIGEFAWSCMEPTEGTYEWGWLHNAIDKLGANGIATILCTPTATPPAWLTTKYPSAFAVDEHGVQAQHGARRHVCPNDPTYRELCARIVTALAKEFADDENVIGWQIDNEVYLYHRLGCCCPTCLDGWHAYLERRFGTIEALNAALCLNLWSQTYDAFDQVPHPRADTWHHPSLKALYAEYMSDSYGEYITVQADILHQYVKQPVGTDMMPTLGVDYVTSHRHLDIVQFNHYNTVENLWAVTFWFNYVRTLRPDPFWNTETATCWNGSVTANGMRPEGFCRVNSWLPIALGGEANLYWLWRAHWAGQELMHGSVISSCARPLHIYDEVCEVGDGFARCAEFLASSPVRKPSLALHLSANARHTFDAQSMVNGFEYPRAMIECVYKPMLEGGFDVDIIEPGADLEGYSVVVTPFLPRLDEAGLGDRIHRFMEQGGTWIAGPMTDCRDEWGAKFTQAPFSVLEDWAGVYTRYQIPGDPMQWTVAWPGGDGEGGVWYDGFDIVEGDAKSVATYTDGALCGLSAAVTRRIGAGRIVLLGTWPGPDMLRDLLERYGAQRVARASSNVLCVPRKGESDGLVVVEYANAAGWIQLDAPMHDLIADEAYEAGMLRVAPYAVKCLVRA